MDNLGISTSPIVIRPVHSAPQEVPYVAPVVTGTDMPALPTGRGDTAVFDPKVADQQRFQAVHHAAQAVSDIFVVSDRTFTIFKDTSGQYVTRFTSLRNGKITYIPEPNLFKMGGENDTTSVKIKA